MQKLHKGLVGYQAGDKGGCINQRRCREDVLIHKSDQLPEKLPASLLKHEDPLIALLLLHLFQLLLVNQPERLHLKQEVNLSPRLLPLLLFRRIKLLQSLLQQLVHSDHRHGSDPPLEEPRQVDIRGVQRRHGPYDYFHVIRELKLDKLVLKVECE